MLFSLPISVSRFLAFVSPFGKMSWIVFVRAMNLRSGKLMQIFRLLYTYPKTTAFNGSIILSLGTGYFLANGHEMAWIASGIAAFPLYLLLQISGMTVMQYSRYMSIFT